MRYSDEFRQFQERLKTLDCHLLPRAWEDAFAKLSDADPGSGQAFASDWKLRYQAYATFLGYCVEDFVGQRWLATAENVRHQFPDSEWNGPFAKQILRMEGMYKQDGETVVLAFLEQGTTTQFRVREVSAAKIALPLRLSLDFPGVKWFMEDATGLFRVPLNYRTTAFYRATTFMEFATRFTNIEYFLEGAGLLLALDWIFAADEVGDNPLYHVENFLSQRSGAPSQSTARRLMRQVLA
jgi:hypothetical protein